MILFGLIHLPTIKNIKILVPCCKSHIALVLLITSIHDPPSGWIRSLELQENRSIVDVSHFDDIPDSFRNVGLGQRPLYVHISYTYLSSMT